MKKEDELLADRHAHLAHVGEKVDDAHPFVHGDATGACHEENGQKRGTLLWFISKGGERMEGHTLSWRQTHEAC